MLHNLKIGMLDSLYMLIGIDEELSIDRTGSSFDKLGYLLGHFVPPVVFLLFVSFLVGFGYLLIALLR